MKSDTHICLFAICPIGFEEIQNEEIINCYHELEIEAPLTKTLKGGVEIKSNSTEIIKLIPYLKVATSVLLRVDEFKVRDFPKLFNKVKKLNWSPFLYKEDEIDIKMKLKKSRLIHSDRAIDTVKKAIGEWLRANPRKKIKDETPPQKVYFNIEDDLCRVSIDLCGTPLYQRENKTQGAIAPIRENLASGLIKWSIKQLSTNKQTYLVDPMCGSGTFILEGYHLYVPNKYKKLSAHFMPIFKSVNFNTVNKVPKRSSFFGGYIGVDNNPYFKETRAEENEITFIYSDYRTELSNFPPGSFIILNPPYGKRIKINKDRIDFYKELIVDLISTGPIAVGIIIPQEVPVTLSFTGYKNEILRFKNGGLPVSYILFIKN